MKPRSKVNAKQFNKLWRPPNDPHWIQCGKIIISILCDLAKRSKTICLVHNFIILANFWRHDQRSMWNSLMSYSVQYLHCSLAFWSIHCEKKYLISCFLHILCYFQQFCNSYYYTLGGGGVFLSTNISILIFGRCFCQK